MRSETEIGPLRRLQLSPLAAQNLQWLPKVPRFSEMGLGLGFLITLLVALAGAPLRSESACGNGCDLALASYYISPSSDIKLNLTYISGLFQLTPPNVMPYNNLTSQDSIIAGTRLSIPIRCDCLGGGQYLGAILRYNVVRGDTYGTVAEIRYSNLTTEQWLSATNSYPANLIPDTGGVLNVTVNCSCGDASISTDYGFFETYPLRAGESLQSVADGFGFSSLEDLDLLRQYNPGVNFSAGKGIVFVPTKDLSGSYRPLKSSNGGISDGAVAGISIAVVVAVSALATYLYFGIYRKKKPKKSSLLPSRYGDNHVPHELGSMAATGEDLLLSSQTGGASPFAAFVDTSVEFPYEELAKATNDFNVANKIGEGGFGAVYYAELRGEKAAIKKMDMEASGAFLAELKVLTHVHHLNLVRLIGYSADSSLILVYEFIDNGNLSQHLRGTGRPPLSWLARVQIALDAARGLEYIHEHTVPVYIHRDIKSANILIDKNLRAKVADFGLAKLTDVGSSTLQTKLVGTFGYMPPEYAQYGEVSPKVDVYAFGVVLYELISAKEAVVKMGSVTETRGLIALFENALNHPEPKEELGKLVDPRLKDEYSIDSVQKVANLAKACTHENPHLRPSMRSIVVALMTLSSSTEDWDLGSLHENKALISLMSGR